MPARSSFLALGLLAGLGIPSFALADDVVVPPLVPRGATQVRDVANITQLVSSELDFMREVDTVESLTKVPSGYGVGCLDNAGCLKRIGSENGGSHVLAGALTVTDATVTLDMVYYSVKTGRFVRRQSFSVDNTPESVANEMGAVVREMVTGEGPKDDAVADDSIDLIDFDEEFEFEFDKEDFAEAQAGEAEARRRREAEARRRAEAEAQARREAEAQARREAEAEARRRAEEERRLAEEARRRAEEEARRAAEEEARLRRAEEDRRRAEARRREEELRREQALREEEARRRAQPDTRMTAADPVEDSADDEFDPNAISFGSAAIVVEDPQDDSADVAIVTEDAASTDYYEEDEGEILDLPPDDGPVLRPDQLADLDEDEDERPHSEKTRKPARQKGASDGFDDTPTQVGIALRGGYSPYYNLGFVTVGGELSVAAADTGVHVIAGFQTYAVQRTIPEEFRQLAGATTEWNTIFPINAGVIYKLPLVDGRVKPYGGADLVFARYYTGDTGGLGSVAFGARLRGGVDLMIVRNVGVTADVALGGWGGGDWEIIQQGVKNAGLLPQVSAGTVIAF